jgi:hypothetical protein
VGVIHEQGVRVGEDDLEPGFGVGIGRQAHGHTLAYRRREGHVSRVLTADPWDG